VWVCPGASGEAENIRKRFLAKRKLVLDF